MQAARGVLIDLGGVVYQGDNLIERSRDAISRLEVSGLAYRFLTNTTSQSVAGIVGKLERIGISVDPAHIFTPATAARSYIAAHKLNPHFLVAPGLMADFASLPEGTQPAVVVGDARDGFTFRALNTAFRKLQDGAVLIALAGNRYYADADGRPSLDAGAFVAALEYASGLRAVVLGKPSAHFFHLAVEDMRLAPKDVVMIGDDAEFDVAAAINAGLQGFLVRTGKWAPEVSAAIAPSATSEFADLFEAIGAIVG